MFTQFAALLAIGAFVLTAVVAVSSFTPEPRRFWVETLGPGALAAAAFVAVVTMAGSLYLSEGLHYRPCRLCWVQRGFAYPLALLLPAALIFRRPKLHMLALPLAGLGAAVSFFHILIEHYPSLEGSTTCDPANPCSLIWVRHFGFVTIPTMALASFFLQITLALTARAHRRKELP